ncbi:MAG: transposase [Lachnospiraceae bacterium]|nr:transposase [Lachnospiraceae bacterium]
MVTAIQRDSGYPFLFRAVPGNIVDVTTLSTTIATLTEYDVKTDLAMLDAGYVSSDNMKTLFSAGIEFAARLSEKNKGIYQFCASPND